MDNAAFVIAGYVIFGAVLCGYAAALKSRARRATQRSVGIARGNGARPPR